MFTYPAHISRLNVTCIVSIHGENGMLRVGFGNEGEQSWQWF
jgi:hypothetical protein